MAKNANGRTWTLPVLSDGRRYSKPPLTAPTLSAVVNSSSQITVTASGASSSLGSITGYLWRRNGALLSSTPSASPLVSQALASGTVYTFTAQAVDSAGNQSRESIAVSAQTQAGTTDPVPLGGVTTRLVMNADTEVRYTDGGRYIDQMKRTDAWQIQAGTVVIRGDQWIASMSPGARVFTYVYTGSNYRYVPPGDYVCKGGGSVTKIISGSGLTNQSTSGDRVLFTVPENPTGNYSDIAINLTIRNDTAGTLTNIDGIVICKVSDEAAQAAGQTYRPEYYTLLNYYAPHAIRMMGANGTSFPDHTQAKVPADLANWNKNRRTYAQPEGVVTWDITAKLANDLNTDVWFNFPVIDDYLYFDMDAATDRVYPHPINTVVQWEHGWPDGTPVVFMTVGLAGSGLSGNTVYYTRDTDQYSFKLATSPGGAAIDILIAYGRNPPLPANLTYARITRWASEEAHMDLWREIIETQIVPNYTNPNGRIIVEVGNEPWNSGFGIGTFMEAAGVIYAAANPADYSTRIGYGIAHTSLMATKVMREYFPAGRVTTVLNSQVAWFNRTHPQWDYVDPGLVRAGAAVKNIVGFEHSIAPYIDTRKSDSTIYTIADYYALNAAQWTDAQWKAAYLDYGIPLLGSWITDTVTKLKAKNPSIPLSTYENGQHVWIDVGDTSTQQFKDLQARFFDFLNSQAMAEVIQTAVEQLHVPNRIIGYAQFVDLGVAYNRFLGAWGVTSDISKPMNPRAAYLRSLPGPATSVGTEVSLARQMITGHSLSPHQQIDWADEIAASLSVTHQWQKQIINGSPLRLRTEGNGNDGLAPWEGFLSGENKTGSNLNLLTEWTTPATITGGGYTHFITTERHNIINTLVYENTIRYLMLQLETFMSRQPTAQPFLWSSWHMGATGLTPATVNAFVEYEYTMRKVWDCVTARINLTVANKGYAWRLKNIPAAYCVARLVDESCNGDLPGITQNTVQGTIDAIFNDGGGPHLTTQVGLYYMQLMNAIGLYRKNVNGCWYPNTITATQAASLQRVAWQSMLDYYNIHEWVPTMAEARAFMYQEGDPVYAAFQALQPHGTFWNGTTYASGNPFVFDAATDNAQAGWYTAQ